MSRFKNEITHLKAHIQTLRLGAALLFALALPLVVGEERVIFVDRNMRLGLPSSLNGRLRAQSAGGAVYLRASVPIEPVRIQLQDVESGALILLDITARPAEEGASPLEPVRIVLSNTLQEKPERKEMRPDTLAPETPIPVTLTRYAAQSLYAPLRTIEPVPGISAPMRLRGNLPCRLSFRADGQCAHRASSGENELQNAGDCIARPDGT
jgi:integrating conjugative element protein (TIGR03749 family)